MSVLSGVANWSIKLRWLIIPLWIAVTTCAAWGIKDLTLTADTRVFFDDRNPYLLELQDFEKKYSQNNNLLVVIHRADDTIFDASTLTLISDLTEAAWALPHASRVDSLANFQRIWSDADSIGIENLIPTQGDLTKERVDIVRTAALTDSALLNRLVSPDGRTTGINVNFNLPNRASNEIREIVAATRNMVAQYESSETGLKFHVTGNVALMRVFSEAVEMDLKLLIPLTLAVSVIVLALIFNSLASVLSVVSVLVFASAFAMGLAGYVGMVLNPASVVAPVVIMILAVAGAIHVVSTVQRTLSELSSDPSREQNKTEDEKRSAIRAAIDANAVPVTLASMTTAIGFIALNLSASPPFRDMGNAIVVGIAVSWLLIFSWLPALLSLVTVPRQKPVSDPILKFLGNMSNWTWPLALVAVIASVYISFGWARSLTLDDDFIRGFDQRFDYARASEFAEENLTGLNVIEFDLNANGPEMAYSPDYLATIDRFSEWLRQQDHVVSVTSITDVAKKINRAMNADDETAFRLPNDSSTTAQYYLLYEISLPLGLELSDYVNVARSSSRLTALLRRATSGDIRELNRDAQNWLAENAPPHMQTRGTSINVVFSHLSGLTIQSMILSTVISILAISIIIGVSLQSWRLGIVSLATNSVPLIIGFGLWSHLIGPMGLAAAVVTVICFGLVVDDTVHFLAKYKSAEDEKKKTRTESKGNQKSPVDPVVHAFVHAGSPMAITTFVICAGFAVLLASGFEINRTLAALTIIVVATALLVDFFLLPPLLKLTENLSPRKQS